MSMQLGSRQAERLLVWLQDVFDADNDLETRRERVIRWIQSFEAQSPFQKDFPFVGCSSVNVPMIAIARDAIMAKLLNTLFGQDRDLDVEPFEEGPTGLKDERGRPVTFRDIAEDLQEYLLFEISPSGQVPWRKFAEDIIDDKSLVGTAFPVVSWGKDLEWLLSDSNEVTPTIVRDNVILTVPDFDRLIFPNGYPDLSRIPFISEKYPLRPSEMLSNITTLGWSESKVREYLREHGDAEELSSFTVERDDMEDSEIDHTYRAQELWMVETWGRVDLNGDGKEIPLLIDHPHKDPRMWFSVRPWPYEHRKSKFISPDHYIRRKNRLLGMGIPERSMGLAEGISAIANQIIDQGTLSNTMMWSVDESQVGIQQLSHASPGKVIPRGDDPNAITPLEMGSVKPDLFEGFNILMMLFEKLTKVSDYDLGRESQQLGRGGTATATLALLQQSNQYFDPIVRGTRSCLNEAAERWLQLLAQQKPANRIAKVLGPRRARNVLAAISLSPTEITNRFSVYVAFSRDAATQELQRQQEMAKLQLLDAYYKTLLQYARLYLSQPFLRGIIVEITMDGHRRLRKLLEAFGESYSNKTLPSLINLVEKVQTIDARAQAQGMPSVSQVMAMKQAEARGATGSEPSSKKSGDMWS